MHQKSAGKSSQVGVLTSEYPIEDFKQTDFFTAAEICVDAPQIAINNTVTMIVLNHNILIHVECNLSSKVLT